MPRGAVRKLATMSVLVILLAACGSEGRPSNAEWTPKWDAIVAVVPAESDLGPSPAEEVCQDTLSALRTQNEDLLPTPSNAIDDLVADWTGIAEAAFFECPPENGSFSEAYDDLEAIEDSIDAALRG